MTSDTAGETVCAALGIGIGRDSHGMIFEYHANSREVAERVVRGMVEEGFARRRLPLERVTVTLAEHRVELLGCAIATSRDSHHSDHRFSAGSADVNDIARHAGGPL